MPNASDDFGKRVQSIDGLRAIAVALVVLVHTFTERVPGGFIGVDIFFVISGFVITRSLLANKAPLYQFYTHRFFRIVPPFLPVVALSLIVGDYVPNLITRSDALFAAFGLMNWARAFEFTTGRSLGHFWSLAIEEQFYLIWPFVLLVLLPKCSKPLTIVTAVILSLIIWQWVLLHWGASISRVYSGFDTRAFQLLFGCLAALISPKFKIPTFTAVLSAIGLLAIALFLEITSMFYYPIGMCVVAIFSAVLIIHMTHSNSALYWPLKLPVVQWCGNRSYAIYLWHFPLLGLLFHIGRLWHWNWYLIIGLTLLLTAVFAEMSYRLIERPSKNLRDRLTGPDKEFFA